ncbi:MAG: DUF1109 domain-containing protein [Casimicrobiaceae bacterium]
MNTDELVALLVVRALPVEPNATARRYAVALGWGALGATLLMAILLGVRPDIRTAVALPMFWLKLAFPASIAVAALFAATRLSRPGARLGRVPVALVAPVVAMWLLAAVTLLGAPVSERAGLVMGFTVEDCLTNVPLLAVPVFAAAFWAMRGLAPTRLALAGGAAGLLAGAIAALIYALHCPEMEAPFLGVWYVAGMLIPAAAGALLGPVLLRW